MRLLSDLRTVATQLQALTGLSNAELARRAEVHRPNCLAWLAGKEQVLSEQKQLKVCELLGWRFGRLRRDMIHRWEVGDDLTVLKQVLATWEGAEAGTKLTVSPAGETPVERAAIISSLSSESPPLVILIRRPLDFALPRFITPEALGMGTAGALHKVTAQEWQHCWLPESSATQPEDYVRLYGQNISGVSDTSYAAVPGISSCDAILDDFHLSPVEFLGLTSEQEQWLALLDRAIKNGMSFHDALTQAETALFTDYRTASRRAP